MESHQKVSHSEELAQRKGDHITLAEKSQTEISLRDLRFDYEPLFFTHPTDSDLWPTKFSNHELNYPIWISSMTGGTQFAETINENLAKLCGKHKLGMGLGSCRSLLGDDDRLKDFAVRKYLGSAPLFANLGVAQIEELLASGKENLVHEMVKKLEASGLIIHLNPLQEWFQPEGDRFRVSPLLTLTKFLEKATYPVIVKEVGQGMGPKSLKALLELPLAAIEFGAFGGTNFTMLENLRGDNSLVKAPFINVGHSASEMVDIINTLNPGKKEFIVSGGLKNILDGFELISRLKYPGLIGMAHPFLKPAMAGFDELETYFYHLRESLLTARGILKVKGE